MKPPYCAYCSRIGHYEYQCYAKPKPSIMPVNAEPFKPGKQFRNWNRTRAEWYKANPPDFDGYYYCHYCGVAMTKSESTLDHKLMRSRYPQFRYVLSNLLICCWACNNKRGSMEYEVFCRKYYPHLLT